jgi:phage terminase small subunit
MTKQQTATSDDEPELGPAMSKLNEKQRRFVLAMLADPHGFQGSWAEAAGYSTKGDSHHVRACRLMQDPRIIAASQEVARQHLGGNGPVLAAQLDQHCKEREASKTLRGIACDPQ